MQTNNQNQGAGNNSNNRNQERQSDQNKKSRTPGNEQLTKPGKGKEHADTQHPHEEKTPIAKPGKK
jgi:hypothetical protein